MEKHGIFIVFRFLWLCVISSAIYYLIFVM